MTVQKMIDELSKLTSEEKALPITMNVCDRDGSEENMGGLTIIQEEQEKWFW